uniref:Acyl-CoA-binding domain-containing protein 5 n=1 Tax=Seriola lalandi dorsalis TaxID=1841481 RepID=A0A3B4YVS9_SERLL
MEVESVTVEDEGRLTQLRFEAAVKVIKSLPPDGPFQPSNDMMLKFYSYYKQATVGACNIPRPGFWDAVGKAKWDAWDSLGNMSKEEAMAAYVEEMKLILEGMPMTDEVEELLRVLGPFYEMIEERKKITQISDLSTGIGTMMNSMASKSVAKSIVRSMEMNGTLETRPARLKSKEVKERLEDEAQEEDEDEEDDEEEEEEEEEEEVAIRENRKGNNVLKKQPNFKISFTAKEERFTALSPFSVLISDPSAHVSGPNHLASDSDSEVYCDSVDQFGQDESPEHNHSLDDLDEEENHVLEPPEAAQEIQEDVEGPPKVMRCGGEDGETGGTMSQRRRLNADMPDSSLVRRGQGSRSAGRGSGALVPMHSGGDGDGGHRGGAVTPGGSLNEQIVVALARLQEDMQSVLQRLHTLEALTASQVRPTKPSWWPFDISPTSLAFAVIWPFVVQWLIRLFLQRRRRKRVL